MGQQQKLYEGEKVSNRIVSYRQRLYPPDSKGQRNKAGGVWAQGKYHTSRWNQLYRTYFF